MKQSTLNRITNISYGISILGIIFKVLNIPVGLIIMLIGFLGVAACSILPYIISVQDDSETFNDKRSYQAKYLEFGIYTTLGILFLLGLIILKKQDVASIKVFFIFILLLALYWFFSYRQD